MLFGFDLPRRLTLMTQTRIWDYNPWTDWNSPWQNIPAGAATG